MVNFPITGLDLSSYVASSGKSSSKVGMIYDLIGVSNHFGSTGGGHYTAYCKYLYYYLEILQPSSGISLTIILFRKSKIKKILSQKQAMSYFIEGDSDVYIIYLPIDSSML